MYFKGEVSRTIGPKLIVNVQDEWVRSACVISNVQPNYAPEGQQLVSVTLKPSTGTQTTNLEEKVLQKLRQWLGHDSSLTYLAGYIVPYSLPAGRAASNQIGFRLDKNILTGGDAYTYPSMNGAALSGRKMAEYIARVN
jgi:hypothetical protein